MHILTSTVVCMSMLFSSSFPVRTYTCMSVVSVILRTYIYKVSFEIFWHGSYLQLILIVQTYLTLAASRNDVPSYVYWFSKNIFIKFTGFFDRLCFILKKSVIILFLYICMYISHGKVAIIVPPNDASLTVCGLIITNGCH